MKKSFLIEQAIPLILTLVIFVLLSALIYAEIVVLNHLGAADIGLRLGWQDILVGMTIYLKTSVDFAIFIGNLMSAYPGWKNRIAIEIGTAAGNALGTVIILAVWNFFRHVEWLLAIMIFIAALVLLKLAEEGLAHAKANKDHAAGYFYRSVILVEKTLAPVNQATGVILKHLIPNLSMKTRSQMSFCGLFLSAFIIPFILGLDDFAGYVPVFNVVNVFGFAVGVLAGHMVLNICLFISPKRTITVVKNPVISFLGSLAFIGLAVWGIYEVIKILLHMG